MPRFTYSMSSASDGSQSHELDLPDEDSARVAAKFVARVFAADNVQSGTLDLSRVLSVSDQVGRTVHLMPLSDAVRVSGA